MTDATLYEKAVQEGLTGYGRKTVFLESPGVGKNIRWWFKNVNQMERSENLNRIALAEAGKLFFNEILAQARGNKTLFSTKYYR